MVQQTIQATRVSLEHVTEAPWNVNVMSPAKFQDLLRDMKAAGPEGTDPIDVCSAKLLDAEVHSEQRVTADGAHRLRAAKQLGWSYLYAIEHPEMVNQEDARLFNYKRDADRGEIDAFKLAESFKWFTDVQGLSQEQIAAKFGIDRTTVSKRLSLLDMDPDVKKHLVARDYTASHLEPISTLTPELQQTIAKELFQRFSYNRAPPNVRSIEEEVQRLKRDAEAERKWQAAVKDAKFPNCPKCKKPARQSYLEPPRMQCETGHTWNMNSGKDPYQDKTWSEPDQKMLPRKDANLPQHFKTSRTTEEFAAAGFGFFQKLFPSMKSLSDLTINGKLASGKEFHLRFEGMGSYGTQFEYEAPGEARLHFYTQKAGKQWLAKGLHTRVTGPGRVSKKEHLKAWEEAANRFLEDYLPRGTRKEKK